MSSRPVTIVVEHELPSPCEWALAQFVATCGAKGAASARKAHPDDGSDIYVGLVGDSKWIRDALDLRDVGPYPAESLWLAHTDSGGLVIAGSDALGLVYALVEAARAMSLAGDTVDLRAVSATAESPELSWRSLQMFLGNEELEASWYHDHGFWEGYLDQLVLARYNNFSLTFSHQTAYLTPLYPFLVPMPEFPDVRIPSLTIAERERNLATLNWIANETRRRGLHFTLGIWQQQPHSYGEPLVLGLPEIGLAKFCATGLRKVLNACPAIDGLQLRMNAESGVAEDQQVEFFEDIFGAVAACGRPIRLDLRAKGLANSTIQQAQRLLPDVVVSSKHWCEHMGQPYPMPAIQQFDIPHYRRYGSWDLLQKPREWPLVWRLWSAGTQHFLQWGSPTWVKHFAQDCGRDAVGFEVMAPLSNKGGRNVTGAWDLISAPRYQPYPYEYQRYWLFYLLFGRIGYASTCPETVWQREFQARYGSMAEPLMTAFAAAGPILPLITTVMQWSASLWTFTPELYAGRDLTRDIDIEPSDPTQFYGINEYVQDALAGQLNGKWTPFHVADCLLQSADAVFAAVSTGHDLGEEELECPAACLDLLVQAYLGKYHSFRLRAGAELGFFLRTQNQTRIDAAIDHLQQAKKQWEALVNLVDGIYHDNLVFDIEEHAQGVHWRSRLPDIDADLKKLSQLREQIADTASPSAEYPGHGPLPMLPRIRWQVPTAADADQDLEIGFQCESTSPLKVYCHYRIAMQCLPFTVTEMAATPSGYRLVIPNSELTATWDMMLFFELRWPNGEARRVPDWQHGTPYLTVTTHESTPS